MEYSGTQNLWDGYEATYIKLDNVLTTSGVEAVWLEMNVTVNEDIEFPFEAGFFQNNDELIPAFENDGLYVLAFVTTYFLQ